MDRRALDTFGARLRLSEAAYDVALDLTGLRPEPAEWRSFGARLARAAGLAGLGAGVLFFVAANWQEYGVLGRFALLETALGLCAAGALWRPPPALLGRSLLLLATLLTGGLLALFGQTWQTGADAHELFFTWALLALPFALAARWGPLWALWFCVVNVGLGLVTGFIGLGHVFWRLITGWGLGQAQVLLLPCLLNLGAAALFRWLRTTRFAEAAPPWLVRLLTTFSLGYGTFAAVLVAAGIGLHGEEPDGRAAVVLIFAALSAALGWVSWLRKEDVFPLALLAASWIAISTTWLGRTLGHGGDLGTVFALAAWLIATSTVSAWLLMRFHRLWSGAAQGGAA